MYACTYMYTCTCVCVCVHTPGASLVRCVCAMWFSANSIRMLLCVHLCVYVCVFLRKGLSGALGVDVCMKHVYVGAESSCFLYVLKKSSRAFVT
jgi:hypothetical protein